MPPVQELARADNWWDSKIPPVLAVSYASALLYDVSAAAVARSIGLIVFVGLCAGAYGHIVNDIFDVEADRNAGKRNHMAGFAPWQRLGLCVLTAALGFAPAALVHYSSLSVALLGIEYLLPTIYSIPPVRLKERGTLGLLCDAMGAHVVPCLYAISVLSNESGPGARHTAAWAFSVAAAVWAVCLGLNGIIIHEFGDQAGDLRAGVSTFATRHEFGGVRLLLNQLYAIELFAFVILLAVLLSVAPLLTAGASAYLGVLWFRVSQNRDFYVHSRSSEATIQCWQFSHLFYECYFPAIVILQLAWLHHWLVLLLAFQVAAFRSNFRQAFREQRIFGEQLRAWLAWRGQLHLDDGAEVRLRRAKPHGARLEIRRTGTQPWHIRMVRPYRGVLGLEKYKLKLDVRAGKSRRVTVGLWQNHAPWNSLGLCEVIPVTNSWTTVKRTFAATEDEDHAYVGIWLGGEDAPLEVGRCSLVRANAKRFARVPEKRGYRIVSCATCWNLTGVHVFAAHLLRGLTSRGLDAGLLMTEIRTDLVPLPPDLMSPPPDITVEELPVARTASWVAHWVTLVRFLSRRAPCIYLPNVDYRHSCISPKLPSSVCVVGVVQSDDPVHYEHVTRLGRYWDAVVCVSEACARKVAELDPSLAPRLHVIPNAVRVPERVPGRKRIVSIPPPPLRIVYHGVLNSYQKRILDLAGILDECERWGIPVRMTIAGDGPEKAELLRACQAHMRSGCLRYLGLLPHDRVEEVLREHDVYLLPSAFEGMPHAMLEAMAQGCVPVVTDIRSAVPELIRDGVNGYRVRVGDIGSFVDRLRKLQADPELRIRLGVEAHHTLLGSKYDVHAMVESYVRVFDQVFEAARTGAYRRPAGRIAPPPKEVAGMSLFPMDHGWAVEAAERSLASNRKRAVLRASSFLRHFTHVLEPK